MSVRKEYIAVAAIMGAIGLGVWHTRAQNEEGRQKVRETFASATANDQLDSLNNGSIKLICTDKATGKPYDVNKLETTDELLAKYKKGCEPIRTPVGGESYSLKME